MRHSTQIFFVFIFFLFQINLIKAQVSFTVANSAIVGCPVTVSANTGTLINPTYSWQCIPSLASISAASNQSTTITFTATGNYTVVLVVASGSIIALVQNTITVNPTPSFSLINSTNPSLNGYACSGTNFTLTALGSTTNSCLFYGSPTPTNLTGQTALANTTIFPATYTVITNSGGCQLSRTLVVNQKFFSPTLIANPTTVCANPSTLFINGSSANTNYTIINVQPTFSPIYQGTIGFVVVHPTISTTYQLWGDSLGCVGTASCLVSVPIVTPSSGLLIGSPSVCSGFSTSLVLPNIGAGSTYTFSTLQPSLTTLYTGSLSSLNVFPTVATVYQVAATNSLGCLTQPGPQLTATINISPPLTITVAQTSATTCIESNFPKYSKPVILSAAGAASYVWFPNSPVQPNNPTTTVRPATSTCYTVIGSTSNCSGINTICVTVIPQFPITVSPLSSTICSGDSQPISVTNVSSLAVGPSSAFTYSWTDSMPISISSKFSGSVLAYPLASTNYTVQVKDARGCVSFANTVTVEVTACTAIEKNNLEDGFTLFPNPSEGSVFIRSKTTAQVTFELIDFSGNLVLKQLNVDLSADEPYKINLETIQKGVYFIRLFSDNISTVNLKLICD
jgi:hypothetical protein